MEEVDLVGCFDAQVWAKEFCKRNTSSDEGTMLGWFANAIMAGYDYAKQEAKLEANGNAQQQVQADNPCEHSFSPVYQCVHCGKIGDSIA